MNLHYSTFSCCLKPEYMTHHCILQRGHRPSASQLIGLAHDAQGTAALRCHKSPGTTPLASLGNNRETERGRDKRSVPRGLDCILAAVLAELQRTVCFITLSCYKVEEQT